jgi:hypothetical protein
MFVLLLCDCCCQAMELTEEQYAALEVRYDKVKPVKDALTAQHSALAARLAQLQSSQHTKQRAFEHGAQEVYSWVHAASVGSQGATAAGMSPQATLLARQAQRAKDLKEQQQQLAAMQQLDSDAAAANEQGLLQLGSVALQAKVASAADADQLALLLSQGLDEAAGKRSSVDSHRVVADGGFEAFVADNCPLSPACGTAPPATAFTAAQPHVAAISAMQQQQQQVRFAALPVEQQRSAPSPQPQTSADAAEQFRQSFLQPDAAAAVAGRAGSSEVAVKVEESEYQFAIIDQVLDDNLLLDQIMMEGCVENCIESGTTGTAVAAAAPAIPEGGASSSGYLAMGPAGGSGSSDNTQLLIGGAAGMSNNNSVAAPAAAAAAAAARSGAPLQMLSRDEVAAAVLGAVQDGASSSSTGQGLNSVIARSSSQCQRDLLMHVGSKEQQQVEQEMDRITSQLKMQQYCLALHMHNVCSKKQIALHYLHCFPLVPEAFSCE